MRKVTRRDTLWGLLATPIVSLAPKGTVGELLYPVDVALVLATDVSGSVDEREWDIQRKGYAAAFRSKDVMDAILSGYWGRIAVLFMEWSGYSVQMLGAPWTMLDSEGAAHSFADQVEVLPRMDGGGNTSISGAISRATEFLWMLKNRAERSVIDVSGDGSENSPVSDPVMFLAKAREIAIRSGITINGLPILESTPLNLPDLFIPGVKKFLPPPSSTGLDAYYAQYVIGGPGAFMIPAVGWEDFSEAIRHKLVFEIAGTIAPKRPLA